MSHSPLASYLGGGGGSDRGLRGGLAAKLRPAVSKQPAETLGTVFFPGALSNARDGLKGSARVV